ncbi:glycyl-radical enzyme activating protein [candidate division CSSED10-310 bacterium]|uniref:Glycyl-radical enzyme activating protein n=1 Tax=candidate division CSSED10-310 bacterium TaxID=2855610 RepID=A0ABV6Z4A8_UNCC1
MVYSPENDQNTAIIFDIQRFSLHDGPGIRTTLFFKGCPLKCAWCQNPESMNSDPEVAFYAAQCKQTYACLRVCPRKAIVAGAQHRINYQKCDCCGECIPACDHAALKIIGQKWSAQKLLAEILKDQDYFLDSQGGITLSGGEPTLQSAFLEHFLPLVKKAGIHITLETCGLFSWPRVEKILPYLDLIYYDLKLMDSEKHRRYTGVDNKPILKNFRKLATLPIQLQARIAIIPGINDDRDQVMAVAEFLTQNKQKSIHCLPYHDMGTAKLPRINARIQPLKIKSITSSELQPLESIFEDLGIQAIIYD